MTSGGETERSWREWSRETGPVAFITGVSTVLMGTLPLLYGLFAEHLHLEWRQLGWLGTAAQAGTLTGTLIGYWLTGRRLLRLGFQLGALCALVAWFVAATANTFPLLFIGRMATAVGVGCVFSIGAYLLAHSRPQARSFSVMAGIQVVCGAGHSALLPMLHVQFGYTAAVASVGFWFLLILLLSNTVSLAHAPDARAIEKQQRASGVARFKGATVLFSVMAFQMSAATFWAFSERIGTASGLAESDIATAVAFGNLGGVPAALLGAFASDRFGYVPILVLATVAALWGEIVMSGATAPSAYLTGQLVFNFGWILGVSYYLALLSKRALNPRLIQGAPIALVIASALGPLWVALFHAESAAPLLMLSLVLCALALLPALFRRS